MNRQGADSVSPDRACAYERENAHVRKNTQNGSPSNEAVTTRLNRTTKSSSASCANEPQLFMSHLHEAAPRVKQRDRHQLSAGTPAPSFSSTANDVDHFNLDGWFYTGVLRKAHEHGNISFIPNHLHFAGNETFIL
ncbi:MAG: hypothetical protein MZU97_24285 [Bacillus subtilis]|nr:hypothetical protein [Bacillus subtilis]